MPNILINLKIINPVIKDSHTILEDILVNIKQEPSISHKDFQNEVNDYLQTVSENLGLYRFLVGSDIILVTVTSKDLTYKMHEVAKYTFNNNKLQKVYA